MTLNVSSWSILTALSCTDLKQIPLGQLQIFYSSQNLKINSHHLKGRVGNTMYELALKQTMVLEVKCYLF